MFCILLISKSAIQQRIPSKTTMPQPTQESDDFAWKRPAPTAASGGLNPSEKDRQRPLPKLPLTRLPGWPTEFPENLTEHREQVLQRHWPTLHDKHVAEIAPFVWHHRGIAEELQEKAQSPDREESEWAYREMARLGVVPYYGERANASFVVLIRNRELDEFRTSMRQLEDRFNRKYHYPYLFLNDEPFSDEFMQIVAASTTSNVTFALIPRDHWSLPDFIDEQRAERARKQMAANNVIYGGSLSYRHMCRFNSGFFYKHPLLRNVDWYWRVEPGVDFYCDIDYDPFKYMAENGKLYSFVIALKELEATVPTLWEHTLKYMKERNVTSELLQYFVGRTGNYNLCHFWSNFEIASLNWLRTPEYQSYFEYLDRAQGFFMERWGDAPVHSLAAGLLLRRDQVHFFNDIAYRHAEITHCPDTTNSVELGLKCQCPLGVNNFDNHSDSCLPAWKSYEPNTWSLKDTEEALRLMRLRKIRFMNQEPRIVADRRRWYDVFAGI
ncbi:hypothetical protein EC988_005378 [Linderina pennispora]|nr:hypothetical protein EC988_005378 [Linderina pennispora]